MFGKILYFVPFLIFYLVSFIQRTAFPGTVFDMLQTDFGSGAVALAGVGASFAYVYGVTQFFAGSWAERLGGGRLLVVSGAVMTAGMLLVPTACGVKSLCAARALCGLGAGSIYLGMVKLTESVFGRRNYAFAIGFVMMAGYAGGMTGTWPFRRLAEAAGWRGGALAIALAAAVCLAAMLPAALKKDSVAGPRGRNRRPYRVILRDPLTHAVVFTAAVCYISYFTIQSVIGQKLLQDICGLSGGEASRITMIAAAVCMGASLLTGWGSRLMGNRRKPFAIAAILLCAAALTVMALGAWTGCASPALYGTAFAVLAAGGGASIIMTMSLQELHDGETMAPASGYSNGMVFIFQSVTELGAGTVLDHAGSVSGAGGEIVYSASGYAVICAAGALLTMPALALFWRAVPETKGVYLNRSV